MPRANRTSRRLNPPPKRKVSATPKPRQAAPDCAWIQTLAEPYLRGYRAVAQSHGSLCGYRFVACGKPRARSRSGFFLGYLLESKKSGKYEFLKPSPPECL